MQRRAAALYATFFFVIALGSYAGLGFVAEPTLGVENPAHTLAENDTFEVDGRTYTVTGVSGQPENVERSATVEWTNESATYTASWENNTTFERANQTYRVFVSNDSGVTLQQQRNRTALLHNDTTARNELVTSNRTEYVVIEEGDSRELVPAEEYFPTPPTETHAEGEQFDFHGNATTVANVTNGTATVTWTAPRTNTVDLGATTALRTTVVRGGTPTDLALPAGANVTLNGEQFAVHYPDNSTAVLSSTPGVYHQQVASIEKLYEQIRGLWAVIVMSSLAGILLLALASLPTRA